MRHVNANRVPNSPGEEYHQSGKANSGALVRRSVRGKAVTIDCGVSRVRELGGAVIAPDRHLLHRRDGNSQLDIQAIISQTKIARQGKGNCCREEGLIKLYLLCDLSRRPVLIKPGHRREVLLRVRRWIWCTSEIYRRISYLRDWRRIVRADQGVGVGWVANNLDKC